jgi:hypothetical protein
MMRRVVQHGTDFCLSLWACCCGQLTIKDPSFVLEIRCIIVWEKKGLMHITIKIVNDGQREIIPYHHGLAITYSSSWSRAHPILVDLECAFILLDCIALLHCDIAAQTLEDIISYHYITFSRILIFLYHFLKGDIFEI